MATFYLILEITGLLGVIIFSLRGPKKARVKKHPQELSDLYVNEHGYLEYINDDKDHHLHIH